MACIACQSSVHASTEVFRLQVQMPCENMAANQPGSDEGVVTLADVTTEDQPPEQEKKATASGFLGRLIVVMLIL